EPQRQHVLHGLLAEVVIDAEDLALVEVLLDGAVELTRGCEIAAERLLDDQPRPAGCAATLAERPDDRSEDDRRDGEVVDAVSICSALLVELGERLGEPV